MSTENPINMPCLTDEEAEAQQSGDFEGLKAEKEATPFEIEAESNIAPLDTSRQCPNCGYIVVFDKE